MKGPAIRERAARLRAAGERQLSLHLAAQVGRPHLILTEGPRMGRTEQFTEVTFATDQPEGQILRATIAGVAGPQLTA